MAPHMGSGAVTCPWLICWFWHYRDYLLFHWTFLFPFFLAYFFLTYFLSSLSFFFENMPIPYVVRGNQTCVFTSFSLFCVISFLCFWSMIICCITFCTYTSLGLLYIFCGCFSWFWFCFLSTCLKIGCEEHLQIYLFCIEHDILFWKEKVWPINPGSSEWNVCLFLLLFIAMWFKDCQNFSYAHTLNTPRLLLE